MLVMLPQEDSLSGTGDSTFTLGAGFAYPGFDGASARDDTGGLGYHVPTCIGGFCRNTVFCHGLHVVTEVMCRLVMRYFAMSRVDPSVIAQPLLLCWMAPIVVAVLWTPSTRRGWSRGGVRITPQGQDHTLLAHPRIPRVREPRGQGVGDASTMRGSRSRL